MFKKYESHRADESEVRYFLKQIVAGQQALHAASVYQVDVKLTNMMVTDEDVIKLIDFGFAESEDSEMNKRVGADGYNSPEMILRRPFHPSMIDPWNDGICIYKMLYGRYCFGSMLCLTSERR